MEFADKVYKKLEESKKEHLKSLAKNYFKANENMIKEIQSLKQEGSYSKGYAEKAISLKGSGIAGLAKKAFGNDVALNIMEKSSWAAMFGGVAVAAVSTIGQSSADPSALIVAASGVVGSLAAKFAIDSKSDLDTQNLLDKTQEQMAKMLEKFSNEGTSKISVEAFASMIEEIHVNDKALVANITHFSERNAPEAKASPKGPKIN